MRKVENESTGYDFGLIEEAITIEESPNAWTSRERAHMSLGEALLNGSYEGIEKALESKDMSDGYNNIIYDSIDVQRLYVAAFVENMVHISHDLGVEEAIGKAIKRRSFLALSRCKDRVDLKSITLDAAKSITGHIRRSKALTYSLHVSRAVDYINRHRYEHFSTRDVAKNLETSGAYLSHIFKEEVGMSLTDYIQKIKIEAAVYYLETKRYELKEISAMLGFTSYSYFSKVFKKHTGHSPTRYYQL